MAEQNNYTMIAALLWAMDVFAFAVLLFALHCYYKTRNYADGSDNNN